MPCCVQEGVVIVDRGDSQGVICLQEGVAIVNRGESQGYNAVSRRGW